MEQEGKKFLFQCNLFVLSYHVTVFNIKPLRIQSKIHLHKFGVSMSKDRKITILETKYIEKGLPVFQ